LAKNLKLNIKNAQLAEALKLNPLKKAASKKKQAAEHAPEEVVETTKPTTIEKVLNATFDEPTVQPKETRPPEIATREPHVETAPTRTPTKEEETPVMRLSQEELKKVEPSPRPESTQDFNKSSAKDSTSQYQSRESTDTRRPYPTRDSSSAGYNRPYQPREGGERRPYQPREGGGDQRPSYPPREGGYNRPYQPREGGERRPYTPREGGDQRPSYPPREGGERRPYTPREGGDQRPSYPPREGGERRPYTPREGGDQRPSYPPREGGERRPYTPREGGDQRPSYPPREGGYNRPYQPREGGERRPYTPREGGDQRPSYPPREGGYNRPYQPREGGERRPYTPREGGERRPYPPREGGYNRPYPPRTEGHPEFKRAFGPRTDSPDFKRSFPPKGDGRSEFKRTAPPAATKKPLKRVGDETDDQKKGGSFRDTKPTRKAPVETRAFDSRDKQGLRADLEDQTWRKKRPAHKVRSVQQEEIVRPKHLKIRLPISIKDLASEMKIKAAQLVSNLFMKGIVLTLNDFLDDPTTVQLLGVDFDCEITIDTSEEERVRVTDKTIKQEIQDDPSTTMIIRPPVVAFMGHVDHGKTSLIDAIRKTNLASGEAGAITQHIGAFKCHTNVGDITILDTPGHEAFSAMRTRGADVTDIIVLVIAGDEGIRPQTIEAIQQAKTANVPIVVALNKCDKPNFNAETVYRQLADQELLPETWGGQTITVNCSAVAGTGIQALVEMLALQAEILELKSNPHTRARGTVIESEMHKGLGPVATVLVQNGTLRLGDALVFSQNYARVKTMHDELGKELTEAGPSCPVKITGLSGLPDAGSEFIVVKDEKDAKELSEKRSEGKRFQMMQQPKRATTESFMLDNGKSTPRKVLNLILRADVQGSVEALKTSLEKIHSNKVEHNIISSSVGEISESDVQLAQTSKAVIIGFHTNVESHAVSLIKELKVTVKLHDIIYHAVDDVKLLMEGLLDKVAQEKDVGEAHVKAIFKASQLGVIAGCQVTDGTIKRSNHIRVFRNDEMVWKGAIASLKRVQEDVREVTKGQECGILIQNFNEVKVGDILQAFEINYLKQEL